MNLDMSEMPHRNKRPVLPDVDENWSVGQVRKLIRLVKKREKILEQLEAVIKLEHHLAYELHSDLQQFLDGEL